MDISGLIPAYEPIAFEAMVHSTENWINNSIVAAVAEMIHCYVINDKLYLGSKCNTISIWNDIQ